METMYVKFDEVTTMDYEHNSLELDSNCTIFEDSSAEPTYTPLKEDLDDLFGLLYDVHFEGRTQKVSTNFAALDTSNNDDTTSSTTIIIDADEAPRILSTSEEQTHP
ncbi:hypothetical protein Tco_0759467 [Tanacetum coccineum]